MTTERLIASLRRKIQDTSYDDTVLLEKLNNGLLAVAGRVMLPDLVTIDTVTTSSTDAFVDLPDDYHRELHFVSSVQAQGEIPIEPSFIQFRKRYPLLDSTGSVECVCVAGRLLYYQGRPAAADTVSLVYYRFPTPLDLLALQVEPDGIPAQFHEKLLVSHGAWEIYDEIEDGLDGKQVNTRKYLERYSQAIVELEEFLGAPDRAPRYIRDDEARIGGYY